VLDIIVESATVNSITVSLVNQEDQTPKQVISFIKVVLISFKQDFSGMFKHLWPEDFVSALVWLEVKLEILGLLHLIHCPGDVVQTILEAVKVG
jgi:hypothetical protein